MRSTERSGGTAHGAGLSVRGSEGAMLAGRGAVCRATIARDVPERGRKSGVTQKQRTKGLAPGSELAEPPQACEAGERNKTGTRGGTKYLHYFDRGYLPCLQNAAIFSKILKF